MSNNGNYPLVAHEGENLWSVKTYFDSEYKADWAAQMLKQTHTLRILINAVRKMLSNTQAHDDGLLISLADFERLSLLSRQQSREFLELYHVSEKDLDDLLKVRPMVVQSENVEDKSQLSKFGDGSGTLAYDFPPSTKEKHKL